MKFILMLAFSCGLLAFAAAYPSSPARTAPGAVKVQLDSCQGGPGVVLQFFLGFTVLEFRVCRFPAPCLLVEEICPNDMQLVPLGSFVPLFLSPTQFHSVQLFGGFSGFCLRATPPLPSCFDVGGLQDAAAAMNQASQQEESQPMKVCTTDEATGEEHCYMMEQRDNPQEVCVYYEETGKRMCYPLGQAQENTKNIEDLVNALKKETRY